MLFADVCAGFISFRYGVGGEWCIFGFLGAPGGAVEMGGGTSSAGLPPHVHRVRASQVSSSLDALFGRRSVRALSSWRSGNSLGSPEMRRVSWERAA